MTEGSRREGRHEASAVTARGSTPEDANVFHLGSPWPRVHLLALTLVVGLFLGHGVYLAHNLRSWSDESAYLHTSHLVVSEGLSVFQDEMTGHRMPLPFYVLGFSQLVWGPSLLAARLQSLALGLIALILVAFVGGRLGGNLAGVLAATILACQGTVLAYWVTATYHSLGALIIVGALSLIWGVRAPIGQVAGMALVSLLFLTRTNLISIVAGTLAMLLYLAKGWKQRASVLVAAVTVPLIFFFWDIRHLKILAYFPVLDAFVRPLGYTSIFPVLGRVRKDLRSQVRAILNFSPTYEFMALGVILLAAMITLLWWRGRGARSFFENRETNLLAGLFCFALVAHVAMFWGNLQWFYPTSPASHPCWPSCSAWASREHFSSQNGQAGSAGALLHLSRSYLWPPHFSPGAH
jgi:4-amino-4-deoxy-L-arabinose transferase-like glycosyltransferase